MVFTAPSSLRRESSAAFSTDEPFGKSSETSPVSVSTKVAISLETEFWSTKYLLSAAKRSAGS
ncbi:MAG: hypothetical protein IKR53_00280 [Clostridia bacterium]|nr:hypothetical protein [Clostridia bacterium]